MDEAPQRPDVESLSGLGDVSRETRTRLAVYRRLLIAWQARINLVAPSTLEDAWRRHFLDSAQLVALAPPRPRRWIDLGSGAGFPGLVAAILLAPASPQTEVCLVESDARKCAFLRAVIAETGLAATGLAVRVLTMRADRAATVLGAGPAVISARALAPLPRLLELVWPFWTTGCVGLFPKGRDIDVELTEARKYWNIHASRLPSATAPDGVILKLEELARADRRHASL